MNVVSFYASSYLSDGDRRDADYRGMLAMLGASCARLGLRFSVVTDLTTRLDLMTYPVADLGAALMPAVLRGWIAFLEGTAGAVLDGDDVVLVDADVLVQHDPREVFEFGDGWDLALTARRVGKDARGPINNGVMFVPRAGRAKAIEFFRAAARCCGREWGEDQMAINRVVAPVTAVNAVVERAGARVLILSVKDHAASPSHARDERWRGATFLHFKGWRKVLMPIYVDRIAA